MTLVDMRAIRTNTSKTNLMQFFENEQQISHKQFKL